MGTIIQIRGTSGSGKSTVMTHVMESLEWDGVLVGGRKKPLYYVNRELRIAALGHYETVCGGCDTIGAAPAVYDLTIKLLSNEAICIVLQEGLLLSEDVKWTKKLHEDGYDIRALFLVTELEECLARIAARRKGVGNNKPLNPGNTSRRVGVIEGARLKLEGAGVKCRRCSSTQAPSIIMNWIRSIIHTGDSHAR